MKKIIIALLISSLFFSFTTKQTEPPARVPFCSALNTVILDHPNNFKTFQGEYVDAYEDGTKNYQLTLVFDGWKESLYVVEPDGTGYVEVSTDLITKAKAATQYNEAAKQLETCLGVKGKETNQSGVKLFTFIKGGAEITLMVSPAKDKQLVMITIEKGS